MLFCSAGRTRHGLLKSSLQREGEGEMLIKGSVMFEQESCVGGGGGGGLSVS